MGYLLCSLSNGDWFVTGHSPPPPDTTGPNLVCSGYVDIESGITSLYPLQPGRVDQVLVQEGQTVPDRTILVRLDDRLGRLHVEEAKAALAAARVQYEKACQLPQQQRVRIGQQQAVIEAAQSRLAAARSLLERKRELLKIRQLSSQEVAAAEDQVKELAAVEKAELGKLAELQLNKPELDIREAKDQVAMLEARWNRAQQALEECNLRAPVGGTVLRLLVGRGEVLSGQAKQPAVLFCPEGPRIIRAEVEQEFVSRVAVGQSVMAEDAANPDLRWAGRVRRVADWYTQRRPVALEPGQFHDVRTVECVIDLDPGQPPPRIGQRVQVTIGAPGE